MAVLLVDGSTYELERFNLVIDVSYTGVMTVFTYPAGVSFDSYDTNIGSFDGTSWIIPNYTKDFTAWIEITVQIDDAAAFAALAVEDRVVSGDTTDLTGEISLLDNETTKLIDGVTCMDVNDCISGDLEEYDTMAEAIADLGDGKMFLASLENLEGWPWRTVLVTPFS